MSRDEHTERNRPGFEPGPTVLCLWGLTQDHAGSLHPTCLIIQIQRRNRIKRHQKDIVYFATDVRTMPLLLKDLGLCFQTVPDECRNTRSIRDYRSYFLKTIPLSPLIRESPGLGCTTTSLPDRPSAKVAPCWVPTVDYGTTKLKTVTIPKGGFYTTEVATKSGTSVHLGRVARD